MIAIVDYGMGNLKNIFKALKYVNAECVITKDPEVVNNSDGVVLPGVGAFKEAMKSILGTDLEKSIRLSINQSKPFLGICLGMQMLFEKSYENGEYQGLSIVKGMVELIPGEVKIPHMGWNSLNIIKAEDPILYGIKDATVYFVHSYYCIPSEDIITTTAGYGSDLTASICMENVHGLQFHPEKSGEAGLKMLDNFRRLVR